jgi:exodeoxyribonuclease X
MMRIRVIDFETTGEAPPEHAPCEIGFTDLVVEQLDLLGAPAAWALEETFAQLCDPGVPMPAETAAIHHLIDADLQGTQKWSGLLFSVAARNIDIWAAHGMKAERQWLTDDMTGGRPWIDTYRCAMRLWPDAPAFGLQVLKYWRWPDGMQRALTLPAHRAGPDSYVTALLLRDMLGLVSPVQLADWSSQPALLPRFPFGDNKGKPWSEIEDSLLEWTMRKDFSEDIHFSVQTEMDRRAKARRDARIQQGNLLDEELHDD